MSDLPDHVEDLTDRRDLRRELAHSRKASAALQQMVDALASHPALEHFVPAALRIVASTFETTDCTYYEHRRGDLIRLRYWFLNGDVFGPEDIIALEDTHPHAAVKILEKGFLMPDAYLGVPFRLRLKAQIVSHESDRPGDEWYDLRQRLDWYTTLNVPLVIDGEADGALIINRGRSATYTPSEIDLAERLAQQLALAIEIDRLAMAARQAASAQASEVAAHAQLDEMAKTDRALQNMTDALSSMPDLDNFIPAALQIIAAAFNLRDCAYYEHRLGDPIRLRYWFLENRVLTPEQIALLDGADSFMRQLAVEGFTVPDSYLGVPFRQRTRATVIDHTKGDPPSVFDDECNRRGWHLELNVPLVVAGEADGALLIYRAIDAPFTALEISLAGRLAQQLALAIEASRLSGAAKHAAVAQERERAASERAAELSRYADVLEQTIDSLVEEEDFLGFIGRLLVIASEQLGTPVAEYWENDSAERSFLKLTCRDGVVYKGSDDPNDVRPKGIPILTRLVGIGTSRDRTKHLTIDMVRNMEFRNHVESLGMDVSQWCRERGVQHFVLLPLLRNEKAYGWLCLYLKADRTMDGPRLDLAFSLAQQVSLAVRMTELAEKSKQSALSNEREAAANSRAVELTKANALLRLTLEQLSDERELKGFPRAILRMAIEQSDAQDGVIFVLDRATNTLHALEYLGASGSPLPPQIEFSRPFPIDDAPIWHIAMAAREPVLFDTDLERHMLLPGAAEWHRKRGNLSIMVVPMFINREPYGYFGLGLPKRIEDISQVDLELIQALTQQASLAVQLTRLAEESKQTAVAQEREKIADDRAAEFSNANEVLRSTFDQLSKEVDLHSFPRTILQVAMNHTRARDGLILVFDKYTDSLTQSDYISTRGLPQGAEFSQPFSASKTPAWSQLVSKRVPVVFDVARDGAMLLPGLAAWHRSRGNRSVIATAMFIGSEPFGYFGITLEEQACDVSAVKIGLMHSLAQQATLAIQLTRLAGASQQAAIMVERQQIVVQERANMAREIHDKLAQGYAAILMQQHTMRRVLLQGGNEGQPVAPVLEQLNIIERLSRDNLAEARKTMDELRINPFGPGDLATALEHCIATLSNDPDFTVTLHLDEDLPLLRRYVETELCRIVHEALTNARKHARSGSARVSAVKSGDELRISVRDDGVGFDMQTIGPSFGIASMEERAARAGAVAVISSAPGRGTEIQVTLTP